MSSNIFFTSDTHWYHTNILQFCSQTRPCATVGEMNERLIYQWNRTVPKNGTVYHLGDVTFSSKPEQLEAIVSQLNGTIHLILGNHDYAIRKSDRLRGLFASVSDYKRININKRAVIACHYPIRSWDMQHHGSYHVYGHCHGALEHTPYGKSMDVGIDARPNGDMSPWSYEEIDEILSNRTNVNSDVNSSL